MLVQDRFLYLIVARHKLTVWQASLYITLACTSLVLHLDIEKYHLPWRQSSESAIDVPRCVRQAVEAR